MSRRTRIFLALLLIYVVGTGWLLWRVMADMDPRYRESAEESQVEVAQMLASMVEHDVRAGAIPIGRLDALIRSTQARRFSAQIYNLHKTRVELRVYVTDRTGKVIYDSTGLNLDRDFSQWRDVRRTLDGLYGARTTRDVSADPNSTVLYVAAPIRWSDEIVGVISVGKPVQSFGQFITDARERTLWVGIGSALALALFALIISIWLVRPFGLVSALWRWQRRQNGFSFKRLARHSRRVLRATSHDLRDAVAGRNTMADQVRTLTHELKSPLSAIAGAAELLQEPHMPAAQRQHFLHNIERETQRIRDMVERMLELSRLETLRVLDEAAPFALRPLLQELVGAARHAGAARHVSVELVAPRDATIDGDRFLLSRAISNLLDNAIDFSPDGAAVHLALQIHGHGRKASAQIQIIDEGPGLPDYAQDRVFDKFYSLPRPHSQKKSTGLGLAFAREIAKLHGGEVTLENLSSASTGAIATLSLPCEGAHSHG